ncbi:MAG: glycosyltransferase family 2 protein [Acidimicrobiales bacterium]
MTPFPPAGRPWLSVVMVTWNSASWLGRCLDALVEHTPAGSELIVVDNASRDATLDILRSGLHGARVIENGSNLGFGVACNIGAATASGPMLCFLNPDAVVGPGWAEPMISALAEPTVGVAGPMLLNPDGTVQEAGVIIASGGHPMQFGHGDPPVLHAASRRVQAVSGACLTVRAAVFEAAGGFDPIYHPAYDEDVDLCLTVRHRLGLDVAYCADARVTHAAQTSVGAEMADALMAEHCEVLGRKWSAELAGEPSLVDLLDRTFRYWAARDSLTSDRLLVPVGDLSDLTPGEHQGMLGLAGSRPDIRVTLAALACPAGSIETLGAAGIEVACQEEWGQWLRSRRAHYTMVGWPSRPGGPPPDLVRATQPAVEHLALADAVAKLSATPCVHVASLSTAWLA